MSPLRLASRSFLLVDDQPARREDLARSLAREGHRITFASDETEALAAVENDDAPIAFAIVDLVLGGDRDAGGRLLPKLVNAPVPPIAIATAERPDVPTVKAAINGGASYFVERPFTASELLSVVTELEKQPSPVCVYVDRTLQKLRLTARELEIARLLLKGLTAIEIAMAIGISDKTVRQHVCRVYEKCGVSSRPEFFHHVFAY